MGVQLAFLLVSALASVQSPPPAAKSAEPTTVARTVALLANEFVFFEVRDFREGPTESVTRSDLRMRRELDLEGAHPVTLWSGYLSYMDPPNERLSFATLPDGSWAIASGWRSDSVHSIHVWRGPAAALKPAGAGPNPSIVHMRFQQVEFADGKTNLPDAPLVFACKDRLQLVGSCEDSFGRGTIWMADLPAAESRTLPARIVAEGVDPRVVVNDGEALLAVRAPFSRSNETGPVRFYRSKDLASWTADLELWQFVRARDNYSVAVGHENVWVVTTGEEQNMLELWDFRVQERRWERQTPGVQGSASPIGSARDRLWYFAGEPELHGARVLFILNKLGQLQRDNR